MHQLRLLKKTLLGPVGNCEALFFQTDSALFLTKSYCPTVRFVRDVTKDYDWINSSYIDTVERKGN